MLQIFAGDSSDLHNRAIMNAIPYAPSFITAWVGNRNQDITMRDLS